MDARMWQAARWFVALGVCVLVVLVAFPLAIDALSASLVFGGDGDPDEVAVAPEEDGSTPEEDGSTPAEPAGEVPSGQVTDGDSAPDADFAIVSGVVRQAATNRLTIGEAGDVVVVVFPLVDGDPGCVALAELEIQLEEADPTEIAVYASSVHTPLANGDEVDDPLLDETVRALAVTDGTPGRLRWDVTDVYRSWAAGELAPPGTPFAVAIAPPEDPADLTFSAREAGVRTAPALVWEGESGCGTN